MIKLDKETYLEIEKEALKNSFDSASFTIELNKRLENYNKRRDNGMRKLVICNYFEGSCFNDRIRETSLFGKFYFPSRNSSQNCSSASSAQIYSEKIHVFHIKLVFSIEIHKVINNETNIRIYFILSPSSA